MPTIRQPSWRPRTIHGYRVEAKMTKRNLDLECDEQWQIAPWTEQARALLIQRDFTAWFVRLPQQDKHFATLIEFTGYQTPGNRPFYEATYGAPIPLTVGPNVIMSNQSSYHYSIVDGRITVYMNGNKDYLWMDVARYLDIALMSTEDADALGDV